jgi:hypothetical protein
MIPSVPNKRVNVNIAKISTTGGSESHKVKRAAFHGFAQLVARWLDAIAKALPRIFAVTIRCLRRVERAVACPLTALLIHC